MNLLTQATQPADPSYRTIPLTQGQVAIVDSADYEELASHKWHAWWSKSAKTYYARRNHRGSDGKRHTVTMHREIMGKPDGVEIDHWDGNGINNRRSNLRLATGCQNCQNQKAKSCNRSGFKGIWLHSVNGNWVACITANRRRQHLGVFDTPEEASAAYIEAAKRLHGEFASW